MYEYMSFNAVYGEDPSDVLTSLYKKGWRLVTVSNHTSLTVMDYTGQMQVFNVMYHLERKI